MYNFIAHRCSNEVRCYSLICYRFQLLLILLLLLLLILNKLFDSKVTSDVSFRTIGLLESLQEARNRIVMRLQFFIIKSCHLMIYFESIFYFNFRYLDTLPNRSSFRALLIKVKLKISVFNAFWEYSFLCSCSFNGARVQRCNFRCKRF